MQFHIRHITRYRYSAPVFCEPLTIRLRPRTDYRQRLLSYSLDIDPSPHCQSEFVDLEGNDAACAWFRDITDSLTITTSLVAETSDVNPFQFVLRPDAEQLPLAPHANEQPHFDAYALLAARCGETAELARQIAGEVDNATVPFVCRMNEWIYARHEKIVRDAGPAWHPGETLERRQGACRDLAVLLIEACRAMNIPARFVSGYGAGTEDALDCQLHAWAEVYLPGAGWRGFDPSLGLALTDRHLALATGRTPADAAPTTGSFRGAAESRLETEIEMQAYSATSDSELADLVSQGQRPDM